MRLINETKDSLTIVSLDSYKEFDKLEPWIYSNPSYCEQSNQLSLTRTSVLFDIPKKIYGNSSNLADLILADYSKKGEVLGALLVGKKGMGKSLLSEKISMKMIKKNVPVIHITRPVSALAINKAVEVLAPCVLYLEEFEKCFTDPQDVPVFLNMFSSTTIKGLMVIIAANDISNVMYNPLLDRPQRLRFRINYNNIDDNTVDEILSDVELSKTQKQVYKEWVKSSKPNIDSLITLVKLTKHIVNPEDLVEYISILNVPKLNDLRYSLKSLTITSWNYPAIYRYQTKIDTINSDENSNFTMSLEGDHKLSFDLDLTVDEKNKKPFTIKSKLSDGKEDGPLVNVELEFELTRNGGIEKRSISVDMSKEFTKPLNLISDFKLNESCAKDLSRMWGGW